MGRLGKPEFRTTLELVAAFAPAFWSLGDNVSEALVAAASGANMAFV